MFFSNTLIDTTKSPGSTGSVLDADPHLSLAGYQFSNPALCCPLTSPTCRGLKVAILTCLVCKTRVLLQSVCTSVRSHTYYLLFSCPSSHLLDLILPSCHFRCNGHLITLWERPMTLPSTPTTDTTFLQVELRNGPQGQGTRQKQHCSHGSAVGDPEGHRRICKPESAFELAILMSHVFLGPSQRPPQPRAGLERVSSTGQRRDLSRAGSQIDKSSECGLQYTQYTCGGDTKDHCHE